jgi:hypothetical protein
MSVLRNIEHKIEGLFEGSSGARFRTHVQPVELARKLVKEMEDHRVDLGLARLRAERVHGLPRAADREQFDNYEESLGASCRSTSPRTRAASATSCSRRPR